MLSRVTWELDVLQSWRRDPVFHVHQALGPYFDLLLPLPPFGEERAASIVAALDHVPRAVATAIAVLDQPAGPLTTGRRWSCSMVSENGSRNRLKRSSSTFRHPIEMHSASPSHLLSPPSIGTGTT